MPRKSRIVIPFAPHHCTQRGVRRQQVFFTDDDRRLYLHMLQFYTRKVGVNLLAYCLMTNHVHLMLVPQNESDLRKVLQPLHTRFAQSVNFNMSWTGHLWQARFYSASVHERYFWVAMKYIERNPVRSGIVQHAADYEWSSAAAHCGLRQDNTLYHSDIWKHELSKIGDWYNWLIEHEETGDIDLLRCKTKADRPCGPQEILDRLGEKLDIDLKRRAVGRPRK